jgi:hypothetical protein
VQFGRLAGIRVPVARELLCQIGRVQLQCHGSGDRGRDWLTLVSALNIFSVTFCRSRSTGCRPAVHLSFLLIAIEPNDSGVGALVLSATRMCSWLKFRTIVAAGLQRGWVCLHEKYLSAKFCCVPLRDSFRVCSPFRIKQWFRPSGLGCWSQL